MAQEAHRPCDNLSLLVIKVSIIGSMMDYYNGVQIF